MQIIYNPLTKKMRLSTYERSCEFVLGHNPTRIEDSDDWLYILTDFERAKLLAYLINDLTY